MPEAPFGVLCMAYGSPRDDDGIEPYYTHIRGGRRPSDEALEDLRRRYRAIGASPLEAITRRQTAALSRELGVPAFVGMKHAPPFIEEAAMEAAAAGVERLIGLPLAPHYARMSFDGYERALRSAWTGELDMVQGFHDHPDFLTAVRSVLSEALRGWEPERLFFTAHSLPERILREGDRYDERLLESCRLVASGLDLPPWEFAFQSQSRTGEPWLGPDLLEAVAASGAHRVLVCPIGFVADHLEILYDLDVEARDFARERDLEIRRTASLNDRPEFVAALAAVVRDRMAAIRGASLAG
ncbi:MAG TPA: ferrochelatase [Candidatus Dormibacteraeota bacterium]|jgi:ferrochelatase|nr:ferrochelatase [Candidatus Dormibacteraeota bacterium]